ncbi:MAG: acyltransferase [Rhizomicrobium sp.]
MAGRATNDKIYYFGIDGLRFLAACLAASFHLCFWSWSQTGTTPNLILENAARFDALVPFTWFGWVGVEIFFVISGLVIANSANGRTPIEFAKGRLLRLYPGAWICATVALAALLYMHQLPPQRIVKGYVASITLIPTARRWVDGVYWTLTVEIAFYALVFGLQIFRRFPAISTLAWMLTIWSGAFNALLMFNLLYGIHVPLLDLARRPQFENILLLRHGAFFSIGIWLWLIAAHKRSPSIFFGIALAIGVGAIEIANRALEIIQQTEAAAAQSPIVPVVIWMIALSALFLFTRFSKHFNPSLGAAGTVLRSLGLMTYPMYLLHTVFGTTVLRLLIDGGIPPYAALFIALCSAIALAWAVSSIAEPILRRMLRHWLVGAESIMQKRPALLFVSGGQITTPDDRAPALVP